MRRLTDALFGALLMAFVIKLLFDMIRPYAPYVVLGLFVVLVGSAVYKRQRYW